MTDHEPAYEWRCTGCKARYEERPEACPACGATSFQEFRGL